MTTGGASGIGQANFGRDQCVEPVRLDVTDLLAVEATVKKIRAVHGRLDYLFNNAGVGGTLDVRLATMAQWRRIVDRN